MTGKVIAVANMKGGVGKTATVVALAEALAANGSSVLVIDADAQANASVCIVGDIELEKLIGKGRTIDAYLNDVLIGAQRLNLKSCIYDRASNVSHGGQTLRVSLLAASSELRLLERELIFGLTERNMGLNAIVRALFRVMQRELNIVGKAYEYVLIDCAPGISAVTEACTRLADLVIVPTIPDFLSCYGLNSFCENLWKFDSYGSQHRPKKLPRVLVTRKRQVSEHDLWAKRLANERNKPRPAFEVFRTVIPEAIAVSRGLALREEYPTFIGKWGVPLITCYRELVKETQEAADGT
jgi:cellulose biosynthesis protein BcsQ